MTVVELLTALSDCRVRLSLNGDKLRVDAPKGALTAELRDALVANKAAIVAVFKARDAEERQTKVVQITPDPAALHEPFGLSDIQQAYLIGRGASTMRLGNVGCHFFGEFDHNDIDAARLERAWQHVIDAHPMLRAVILDEDSQVILDYVPPYPLDVTDLRGRAPDEVDAHLDTVREEMSHHLFPPDRWPMFDIRLTLLDDRTRIHVSLDLIVMDAASVLKALSLWGLAYDRDSPLPEFEFSFRDYMVAEATMRATPEFAADEAYWRDRLDALPGPPELPRATKVPERTTFVSHNQTVDAARWQRIKTRASQSGLTPSNLILAAFAEVLRTWSDNRRFVINVTLFGRPPVHDDIREIIGEFTSNILVEIEDDDGAFEDRARRVRNRMMSDLNHARYSGVRVIRELSQRHGELRFYPIVFTSMLGWASELPDLSALGLGREVHKATQTPQVSMDHQVVELGGELRVSWDVVEGVYPEGMIEAMFEAYGALLTRLADDDSVWMQDNLNLTPPDHLRQRAEINATDGPRPTGGLHSQFFERAATLPNSPAIITSDCVRTYRQVALQASAVAETLTRHPASADSLVAVVMDKGPAEIEAVMGVLAAGRTYLPLDPHLPPARLAALVEDSGAEVILTQSWLQSRLDRLTASVIAVDELPTAEQLVGPQTPSRPAYVIYTSGSTGTPKGAVLAHDGPLNTVTAINERFGIGANDRVFAISALSFDLSVYDVFGTLSAGAALVMPDADRLRDPAHWADLMRANGVTFWNSAPPLMDMLLSYIEGTDEGLTESLQHVLLSGDWIPVDMPDRLRTAVDGVEVIGLGGPTETSIWSVWHEVADVPPDATSIPYGRPMRNMKHDVLDDALAPRPIWVPGVLYNEGVGLADGYWRDPGKTDELFVRHPDTGARMYRTGDLARFLPDGNVEILGRADLQVKLQGHRVELREVESVLARSDRVERAACRALGPARGSRRLVAYVVPSQIDDEVETLQRHLEALVRDALPSYMVPTAYVVLERFPLTTNGKLDREALPDPERAARPRHTAPATAAERAIVEILREVLELADVSVEDRFFDLGATSVDMVKVHRRIKSEFGRNLSVLEVFEHPTARALAGHLGGGASIVEPPRASQPAPQDKQRVNDGRNRLAERRKRVSRAPQDPRPSDG